MKKIITIFICLILFTGCFPSKVGIVHTDAKDAIAAIESKDDMILVVGKKNCGACEEFQKVMQEITENYQIRITEVFIDDEEGVVDEVTQETTYPEYEELEQYIGVVGGTPTIYFIQDGVIKGTFTGSVSYDTFKEKIEKYGFLPES